MPVELPAYHELCETFRFLLIDVLAGLSLHEIIAQLKKGKGDYEVEYRRSTFIRGDKESARNAAFQLVYSIQTTEKFEDENKASMKIFNAVKFVVSHRAIFKYKTRKIVRASYDERFCATAKQVADLDKWPIREPGLGEEDLGLEGTTEESSSSSFGSSDDGGYCS